jgi:CBS domain containing-hemolysin-like protein
MSLFLVIVGFAVTALTATATTVLKEIAWHELEERCKAANKPKLFGEIFEIRGPMAIGCGVLQMIATTVMATALLYFFIIKPSGSAAEVSNYIAVATLLGFLLLLSGNWIPWAIARIAAVPFLYRTWRIWWVVSLAAWPLAAGGAVLEEAIARASGAQDTNETEEEAFEDEILSMVSEGEHDGYLESEARDMIEGVIQLDDKDVADVMTPRTKVDALEESISWEDMMDFVIKSGRTRIPIYRDTIDTVVGLLYAKDLLRESLRSKRRPLQKFLREPLFVPASIKLDEMLNQFLHGRTHLAIVNNEYGGVAGCVTIEDVLEEIVGEIVDETDTDLSDDINRLNDKQADVNGKIHIEHLNHVMGIDLPDHDEFATVSGLIMSQINEVPRSGHEIAVGNVQFNILEATKREIKFVRITVLPLP